MTPNAVASELGKSTRTIYQWMRDGKLPAKQIGRTWLVKRDDLP